MAPRFKTIDGRLHKLIDGEYLPQEDMGFWNNEMPPGSLGILDPRVWMNLPNMRDRVKRETSANLPKDYKEQELKHRLAATKPSIYTESGQVIPRNKQISLVDPVPKSSQSKSEIKKENVDKNVWRHDIDLGVASIPETSATESKKGWVDRKTGKQLHGAQIHRGIPSQRKEWKDLPNKDKVDAEVNPFIPKQTDTSTKSTDQKQSQAIEGKDVAASLIKSAFTEQDETILPGTAQDMSKYWDPKNRFRYMVN